MQATSALDEKSRLEKALRDLQIAQGDQKVKHQLSRGKERKRNMNNFRPFWADYSSDKSNLLHTLFVHKRKEFLQH